MMTAYKKTRNRFDTVRQGAGRGCRPGRFIFLAPAFVAMISYGVQSPRVAAGSPATIPPQSTAPALWPRGFPRRVAHTFRYVDPSGQPLPRTMSIVGDFNDWSNRATPMRQISHGVWAVTVKLAPGLHHYRFSLNQHGNAAFSASWIVDPNADPNLQSLPNAFGRISAGVRIPWPWQNMARVPPNCVPILSGKC